MAKKYLVTLEVQEREELTRRVSAGKSAARKLTHARVLLMADESPGGPARTDQDIAESLAVSVKTVETGAAAVRRAGLGSGVGAGAKQADLHP